VACSRVNSPSAAVPAAVVTFLPAVGRCCDNSHLLYKVVGRQQVETGFMGTCFDNSRPSCGLGSQSHKLWWCLAVFIRKMNDVETNDFCLFVNRNLASWEDDTWNCNTNIQGGAKVTWLLRHFMILQTVTESGRDRHFCPQNRPIDMLSEMLTNSTNL